MRCIGKYILYYSSVTTSQKYNIPLKSFCLMSNKPLFNHFRKPCRSPSNLNRRKEIAQAICSPQAMGLPAPHRGDVFLRVPACPWGAHLQSVPMCTEELTALHCSACTGGTCLLGFPKRSPSPSCDWLQRRSTLPRYTPEEAFS